MIITRPIYQLRPAEAFEALDTSEEGLLSSEAAARQALYGKNSLIEEKAAPIWKRFGGHILHPFSALLVAAGGIAFITGEGLLGMAIWIIVVFNAGFSFWRGYRAEEAMQALRGLLPSYARVTRDGEEVNIPVAEVVPGDVLILAEGDYVAADARVVEQFGLRVNNATLTGEAIPALKTSDASFRVDIGELEQPNLIFAGTSVVSGTGRAVVYAIGMLTQFGRVAYLTQSAREEISVFQAELVQVTRKIAVVGIAISAFVFLVGLSDIGLRLRDAFLLALGVLVATIPEGLQANVTLSLASAAQRLAQQGVLVKRLAAIETLGTLSVICTDKSGTLTQNQMTVREIWVSGRRLSVTGIGYEPSGKIIPDNLETGREDLNLLLTAASLCNNSRLTRHTNGKIAWAYLGDQTEAAMRVVVIKGGLDEISIAAAYPRVHELPFDARRKRMSTIHSILAEGKIAPDAGIEDRAAYSFRPAAEHRGDIAFVKGAPREILELCTHIRIEDQIAAFDEDQRQQVGAAIDEYASQALRVLALAFRELPPQTGAFCSEMVERGLTFLGLMAMHDPPRPEVERAVRICKEAGIRMVMITGDYGLTAAALGKRVGLLESSSARIVTGSELETMEDSDLAELLAQEVVFARMAPEHKLRLVAAYQSKGEVVAVTGDGVNDAPALRKADIGVAMGISGSEVVQKSADIILIDDNFMHLAGAIEEGRAVFENLRKFVTYIFSSNVPEVLPFVLTALTNLPLALTVRQILAIDIGTDLLPGLALGMEPPEPGIMRRPPRRRSEHLIDRSVLHRSFFFLGPMEALLAYSGFFLTFALLSPQPPFAWAGWEAFRQFMLPAGSLGSQAYVYILAITVYHAGVVMAQVGNAIACRTAKQRGRTLGWFKNRYLWLAVGAEVLIILALIYIPPLARAFTHTPIPAGWWLWLVWYAPVLYLLDWVRKQAVRHYERKNTFNKR